MKLWDKKAEERRYIESSWTDQRPEPPQEPPARSPGLMIGIGVAAVLAIGSVLALGLSLRHSPKPMVVVATTAVPPVPATPASVVSAPPSAEDQAKILMERIMSAPNAVEAAKVSPLQNDYNEISAGTMLFARWAMTKMTWAEVSGTDETTFGRIMKEPNAERGKHACWRGSVVEIHSMKSDAGQTYYTGGILDPELRPIRFVAVHSSGDIVIQSATRICGTVVGTFDYDNVVGGQTQAIQVVGMFDLPENHSIGRDRGAPKPSTTGAGLGLMN